LARQDPGTPYTGGRSTFYRFTAKLRAERDAGAVPVIRFEGLPGEYVQWDWGEARVRLGGALVKRVCRRPAEVPGLLQGLVLCGICGDRMTVRYRQGRGRLWPEGRARSRAG
jgi:hypothetical protein